MKNKGFTLVEIMAVLVIMGVLLLITVPSIFNSIDRKKNNEHQKIVDEIISAAELYVTQNQNVSNFLDNSIIKEISIPYTKLIEEKLIDGNQLDPLTEQPWDTNSYVKITKTDTKLTSQYLTGNIESTINITAQNKTISLTEIYYTNKILEGVTITDSFGSGIEYKSALTYKCQQLSTGEYTKENCNSIRYQKGTHKIKYYLEKGINNSNIPEAEATITIN